MAVYEPERDGGAPSPAELAEGMYRVRDAGLRAVESLRRLTEAAQAAREAD